MSMTTADDEQERRAAERLNRRRVTHEPMVCPVCDETFTPTRSDAATCPDRCRQRLRRSRLAAETIERTTDAR